MKGFAVLALGVGAWAMQAGVPAPAAPGPALPDAFAGPFWRVVAPGGGSASISHGHLFLGVPGGSNHDALLGPEGAVRVVQAIGNQDFDVAIRIDSPLFPADDETSQGLMVSAGGDDFVTFAATTGGRNVGLRVDSVNHRASARVFEDADFAGYQNPLFLRLTKNGTAFAAFYSLDGINWTQIAAFTFLSPVTSIGPFAANYNRDPAKAVPVVMSVNWFDVAQ